MENDFIIYKDNLFWIILYPLFATSFLILILYFCFPKLLSVSKPNEKTSVIHKDFLILAFHPMVGDVDCHKQ